MVVSMRWAFFFFLVRFFMFACALCVSSLDSRVPICLAGLARSSPIKLRHLVGLGEATLVNSTVAGNFQLDHIVQYNRKLSLIITLEGELLCVC